jgi:hypothetical protein
MDEKYLDNLYNQLVSVDPSYKQRHPVDEWILEIQNVEYASKLFDQISQYDPSFPKRYKKEDWLIKVGAGKGGIKKSEIGGKYYQQEQEQKEQIIETEKSLAEEDPDLYIKQNKDKNS